MGTIARCFYRRLDALPLAVAFVIGAPLGAACQETSTPGTLVFIVKRLSFIFSATIACANVPTTVN